MGDLHPTRSRGRRWVDRLEDAQIDRLGLWQSARRHPGFIKRPALAIDLPLKALVWEDDGGKVSLSYNSAEYLLVTIYGRHGAPVSPDAMARLDVLLTAVTDAAVK